MFGILPTILLRNFNSITLS